MRGGPRLRWSTATTTTLPLPSPYREAASPPPPAYSAAAGMVPSDDLSLQQLTKVLTSLGYNEMASVVVHGEEADDEEEEEGVFGSFHYCK